jgi:hypothetical protein
VGKGRLFRCCNDHGWNGKIKVSNVCLCKTYFTVQSDKFKARVSRILLTIQPVAHY